MKPWSVEECEAYAKQLRDKTRANTAEHAAQAIEYLLGLVKREWVGLTDEEIAEIMVQIWSNNNISVRERSHRLARAIEAAHGIKE